ncbi:MAG: hypothetical protein ABII98_02760 [bacterium]
MLQSLSSRVEPDFGWHLQFGKDAWSGNFQFLDSYTWPHLDMPWTNHEWGGDLIFWPLYNQFGYFSLVLLISLALLIAFLIIQKTYSGKIDFISAIIVFFAFYILNFLLCMRLAMLAPLFLAILLYTLEKIPWKKTFLWWPPLLWLWSALHGSWILAFIVINIYIVGNLLATIINKYWPKYSGMETDWTKKNYRQTIIAQIISFLVIAINPYGLKIYGEIISYFTSGYYKQFIAEWIPSYAYPVYAWPLILATVSAVFVVMGYKNKKISLPRLLLFFALFYAGFQYKRHNLFMVMASLPILTIVFRTVWRELKIPKKISVFLLPLALAGIIFFSAKINFSKNIWTERKIITSAPFTLPYDAVEFLHKKIGDKKTCIFNEFRWGVYLNWMMPNSLVFFDGRGAATWMYDEQQTTLEKYREIKFEAGGLKELNSSPAQYVLLEKYNYFNPRPDFINKIMFNEEDFKKITSDDSPQLEKMLDKSRDWKLIYEDRLSKIWERK